MEGRASEKGELLLPVLAVLFLFGLFWVAYVRWCRHVYWKMRMDMAADATALSAAREEAAILNTIGTYQYLENTLMQKAKVGDTDIAFVQAESADTFEKYNQGLRMMAMAYKANVLNVARLVAKANGADKLPVPLPPPQHHLKPQGVEVRYLYGVVYVGQRYYREAYYVRDWWPKKTAPQPVHRTTWVTCHDGVCEKGKARLWLDADPGNVLNNGGFPSEQPSWWRGIGIQCNFPQFNARLMPKN